MSFIRWNTSSGVPCEKFNRPTSIPACIILRSTVSLDDAGPSVQIIPVRTIISLSNFLFSAIAAGDSSILPFNF
jgi:hypothetical protein